MKNRLAALERSEQSARTAAPQPEAVPQVPLPLALIDEAAAEEAASARKVEQLDRALSAEHRDAAWADTFEHSVREVLAADMFAGNRIDAIECGHSLCRLEVAHDDEASRAVFEDRFPREAPSNQGGYLHRVRTADGSYATEGYLARRGSTALLDVSPPDPTRGP